MSHSPFRIAFIVTALLWSAPSWAYWRATVVSNQQGGYNALSEHVNRDGNVDDTILVGKFRKKSDARKAAKKKTKEKNEEEGVKAGDPVCEQPNVYC
ncbi:MAG TPA: hypothetical protein ENK18_15030 [Deltaproteobacteria bacterium]|nr:hypothetical protein [Deltaproteobacteria bacterium]